jgi:hypothetical protein
MLTAGREIAWCDIEIELSGDPIAGRGAVLLPLTPGRAGT